MNIFIDDPDLDFSSRETQLQLIEFEDKLQTCYGCDEQWIKKNTLQSWYRNYNFWVSRGECFAQRSGIKPFDKVVPSEVFYTCLWEFLADDFGSLKMKDLILNNEDFDSTTKINAYKVPVQIKKIDSVASQGVKILNDIRLLEATYGPEGTYSYAVEYLDFEQYVVFVRESVFSCGLTILAVIAVIFIITANFTVTLLVATAVILVNFFVVALVFYWDLTMNSVVVIQVVIAIGLAVDYSAHIAYTYLSVNPPNTPQFQTIK